VMHPPLFFFLYEVAFLWVHINIRIFVSIFAKKKKNSIAISLNPQNYLSIMDISTILAIPKSSRNKVKLDPLGCEKLKSCTQQRILNESQYSQWKNNCKSFIC
jgi:hypothetical protein